MFVFLYILVRKIMITDFIIMINIVTVKQIYKEIHVIYSIRTVTYKKLL